MKKVFAIFAFVAAISIFGCNEDDYTSGDAVKVELNDIVNTVGFEWYFPNFYAYNPDPQTASLIHTKFLPGTHKFVIFTKPACSCDEATRNFPRMMKVLNLSGISDTTCVIYSIGKTSYNHPFTDELKLMAIPSVYIFKDNIPIYSVIDTLTAKITAFPGDTTIKIERYVLEALSK